MEILKKKKVKSLENLLPLKAIDISKLYTY